MMNKTSKSNCNHLMPGTLIKGKWNKKHYRITRKLGSGAVGTVYLCEFKGKYAALKISEQGTSMTVEVNVLKSLEKVQGQCLGPFLLDVDDWNSPQGKTFSFYVMEYLEGTSLNTFFKHYGTEWVAVFILQLLETLEKLHQAGWVFGDLKTDNLLVVSSPPTIRWVDVGGTTQIGRAIKEYTEFYDRGYWGMGTRRAEPSYDLFALVMVFLNVFYPNRFSKTENPKQVLMQKIHHVHALRPYKSCLMKAILGKYESSSQMKADMMTTLYQQQQKRTRYRKKSSKGRTRYMPVLIESGGILLLATGYYVFSLLFP